jgi:hypothetical protein
MGSRREMRMIGAILVGLTGLLAPTGAQATQDEFLLPHPLASHFFHPKKGGIRPLSRALGSLRIGVLPLSETYRWQGRVEGAVALFTASDHSALVASLSAETLADHRNEISFRLVRVFYDFMLQGRWKLGPGTLHAGYRHRCSHGADSAVPGRILIRSGLEVGYQGDWNWKQLTLSLKTTLHVTMIGQNTDTQWQPRMLWTLGGQIRWAFSQRWSLVAAVGAGTFWVGSAANTNDTWTVGSPIGEGRAVPFPVTALGVGFRGEQVRLRLLIHYQQVLDTGMGNRASPTDLLATQLNFSW